LFPPLVLRATASLPTTSFGSTAFGRLLTISPLLFVFVRFLNLVLLLGHVILGIII
jgi:hypothetical protein